MRTENENGEVIEAVVGWLVQEDDDVKNFLDFWIFGLCYDAGFAGSRENFPAAGTFPAFN